MIPYRWDSEAHSIYLIVFLIIVILVVLLFLFFLWNIIVGVRFRVIVRRRLRRLLLRSLPRRDAGLPSSKVARIEEILLLKLPKRAIKVWSLPAMYICLWCCSKSTRSQMCPRGPGLPAAPVKEFTIRVLICQAPHAGFLTRRWH